jgi:hypothetical protein
MVGLVTLLQMECVRRMNRMRLIEGNVKALRSLELDEPDSEWGRQRNVARRNTLSTSIRSDEMCSCIDVTSLRLAV